MARFLSQDNWKFYHIDDAEANRKRVMLIGTAILTTIDHLVDAELFGPNSAIRNVGFIIGLFFEFVVAYEETCESIEDGWRFVVVRKLDEFDIKIRGLKGAERIAEGLREIALEEEAMDQAEKEEQQEAEKDSHDPNPQNDKTDIPPSTPFPNFVNAYKPDIAADSEFRSWDAWDWEQEVRIYTVWHGIDGKIEGNQYDLTLAENYESDDESMSSDDASDVSAR
ncbi:MAG: hypothetical protein L6R42_005907 [Xanthoria sp. 1 TBL-2021]|nr:MAG: hypothetical protein L6R42_005907 [Xanthoria sp. 1 TBL-2021]